MHTRLLACLAAIATLAAAGATAEAVKRPVRLIGEAPAAKDPAPTRFVIDAVITPGADFQSTVEGWFAGLGQGAPTGSVEGSCIEARCTVSVDVEGGKFALIGDFGEAAEPIAARFQVKDDDGKPLQQGAANLRPIAGPIDGLPALAAPGAIDAAELDDLLMWNGQNLGFGAHDKGEPPSSFQRSTLADWQSAQGRPGTGLIFAADLDDLRAGAAAARRDAGWAELSGAGWRAGYPAAILKPAGGAHGGQRFASADGGAVLTFAIDPPMTGEAFDAFVEAATAEHPGRTDVNYTRVNSDMEISYKEGGKAFAAAYHNREGGLARVVFTYPADQEERYGRFTPILQRSLAADDDLKR